MAIVDKQTLKGFFEQGDIPTQGQYFNFIDSTFNLAETSAQVLQGTISASSGDFEFLNLRKAFLPGLGVGSDGTDGMKIGTNFIIGSTLSISGSFTTIGGGVITDSIELNGTTITSTGEEINFLDGVLSNVKEAYDTVENVSQGNIRFTELDNGTDDLALTNLTVTGKPTFAGLTLSKVSKAGIGNFGDTVNAGVGQSITFTLSGIPTIPSKAAGITKKSLPTFISASDCGVDSTIFVTCTTHELSATAFGNASAAALATSGFFISLANESLEDFDAGAANFSAVIL